MIVIGEPYARYTPTLGEAELERAAANLLAFADRTAQSHFDERYERLAITIVVRVEVGSTRVWITIGALVSALTFYGNIRQSVDYLVKDAQILARLILPGIPESLGLRPQPPEHQERRLGTPGQLRRLFIQVERRELLAEEATSRALRLLQRQGGTDVMQELPSLTRQLSAEFHDVVPQDSRALTEQLSMPYQVEVHGDSSTIPPVRESPRPVLGLPPAMPIQRRRGGNRQTGSPDGRSSGQQILERVGCLTRSST